MEGTRPPFFLRFCWWVTLKRFRPGGPAPVAIGNENYLPGIYYRMCGRRWRGPRYITAKARTRDLLLVIGELTSIIRTNAPLMDGLEASAREEQRMCRQINLRRINKILLAVVVCGVVLGFGGVFASMVEDNAGKSLSHLARFMVIWVPFVPIGIALAACVLSRDAFAEAVLLKLRDSIARGESLSSGMQRLSRFFPRFYVDMVRAGEDTGKLTECLDELGEETLTKISIGNTIRVNLIYLSLVAFVQAWIVSFILLKVLPIFSEMWNDFGGGLPAPTRYLIYVANFLAYNWWLIPIYCLVVYVLLVGVNRFIERSPKAEIGMRGIRRRGFATRGYASLFLLVPGLRTFLIKQNLSTVALILEKLLKAGVPIADALDSAARADLNPLYRRAMIGVQRSVIQGETLADALESQSGIAPIPKSFRGFVAMGEHSGMLPEALARVSELYQGDVARGTRILSDTMLPLCVLFLGYITLFVLVSCYLPIFSLSDMLLSTM